MQQEQCMVKKVHAEKVVYAAKVVYVAKVVHAAKLMCAAKVVYAAKVVHAAKVVYVCVRACNMDFAHAEFHQRLRGLNRYRHRAQMIRW